MGKLISILFSFLLLSLILLPSKAFAEQTTSLVPSQDGSYLQWTPKTGISHYQMVDESICNGITDYNSTSVVGSRDSYIVSLSSIPDYSTISQIDITPCASRSKSGGGNSTMNVFYRLNGVNSVDLGNYSLAGTTPINLSATSYTGLSITKLSTTTVEVGAILSSGTKGVRLGRLSVVITYALPQAPSVATNNASEITRTTANLNSTINPNGSPTLVYYKYGTANTSCSSLPLTTNTLSVGSGVLDVSPNTVEISSLSAGTTYYSCSVAVNNGGTTYGNVSSFTTLLTPPDVTTLSATYISSTSAILNSSVNPNGLTTSVYYKYGTMNTSCDLFSASTSSVMIGSGVTYISPNNMSLSNLFPGTTYYFCAVGSNIDGVAFGSVQPFTTPLLLNR